MRTQRCDAFVSTACSGALLAAAATLRQEFPKLALVGVEVTTQVHGCSRLADAPLLEGVELDQRIKISLAQALEMKDRLAREEGLLVGIATAANVVAAVDLCKLRQLPIFTLSVDSGERA